MTTIERDDDGLKSAARATENGIKMRLAHAEPTSLRRERGVTLLEVMVVICVLGILFGMSLYFGRSGKTAGRTQVAVSTGQAYAAAIEQFATDHAGRYPDYGGDDWPDPVKGPVDLRARGGLDGRYLRSLPEAATDGRVEIGGSSGEWGGVTYSGGGNSYELSIHDENGELICAFGSDVPDEPCAK